MINVFSSYNDKVISSIVLLGDTTYDYALQNILPLANRFDSQRKIMDAKFYERLKRDIIRGCIMPPITIAFVQDPASFKNKNSIDELKNFVNEHISEGYILDGLQRINTLKRASEELDFSFDRPILLNIIIAENEDKLLYRMITLNNGQKPMSPRHQIEILTQELFDFADYPNLSIQTEKEKSSSFVKDSYSVADISKAYLAFITESVHIDNNKFIEEKMDQILVGKIMDTDITAVSVEFKDILSLIDGYQSNITLKKWFKLGNNMIAFCVGIKKNYDYVHSLSNDDMECAVNRFENAFAGINSSKVNVGKIRRELVKYYISNLERLIDMGEDELLSDFATETAI